ncbi:type III secretion system inner membrane ring subunit SctD [Simkania negevensis]|uniref:Type III secretion system inner membrane ring subunit SctD n=1 Tax=Simkania negevensis TaxID=83561 RepID=A0ABS3AQJ4_9BACT|nr:type III secretion system inner membrane ring subunit SctD [Simkania negevensis]
MTGKLVGLEGNVVEGMELSFDQGNRWVVGSDAASCDFVVDDPEVAPVHFVVEKIEDRYLVDNLDMDNPVTINGEASEDPAPLANGDELRVGSALFTFVQNEADIEAEPEKEAEPELESEPEPEPEEEEAEELPVVEEEASPAEETAEETAEEAAAEEEEITAEEEEAAVEAVEEEEIEQPPPFQINLEGTGRFLLKVLTGPNSGAEFPLQPGRSYLLGSDALACDVVFYDLSVSRQHARVTVDDSGNVVVEDLDSRNGVIVDGSLIQQREEGPAGRVITLGTTSLIVLDREAKAETVVADLPIPEKEAPLLAKEEKKEEEKSVVAENLITVEELEQKVKDEEALETVRKQTRLGGILLIVALIIVGVFVVIALISLFTQEEVKITPRDYQKEIVVALRTFPGVTHTYNSSTRQLFLVGHVLTGAEEMEMLYNLRGVKFLSSIENNVIIDAYVWKEYNILLAKNPNWKGVSLQAANPGLFSLSGYLKSEDELQSIKDYFNLHFPYIDRLQYNVVVEETLHQQVLLLLQDHAFNNVSVALASGELALSGYINKSRTGEFASLLTSLGLVPGIRSIKDLVAKVDSDQSAINITSQYTVQGYASHGQVSISVMIDGEIRSRGDVINEMVITSITPHAVLLEKGGMKYKIEYKE